MLDKALLQDLVHDVRGKAQEILDMTADAVQEESAAEPQAVAPSNGKDGEAISQIDKALKIIRRDYGSPDPMFPCTWYQRCEVCGLDERTNDGLGNMRQTFPDN